MTLCSLVFAYSYAAALNATPHVFPYLGVLWCVFVALWAMGYQSPLSFEGFDSGACSKSSTEILLKRDGLQVSRIHATADTAKVVDLESFGDLTNEQLIGNPMGFCANLLCVPHDSVAANINSSDPKPTSRIGIGQILRFKPLQKACSFSESHTSIVSQLRNWRTT